MAKARKRAKKKAGSEVADGPEELHRRWQKLVARAVEGPSGADPNDYVQWVLRQSYQETNKDLQFHADKVRFFNDLKRRIREEATRLRQARGHLGPSDPARPDGPIEPIATLRFDRFPAFDECGRAVVKAVEGRPAETRGALEACIWDLESQLASTGDDAQLANIDLQNMLQRQQQTVHMLSNISKSLHDTALAIIRNIG